MEFQFNRYVLALAINTIVVAALFFYTWRLKKAAGARYFAFALLACLFWDIASVLELSATVLSTKILFIKVVYFGVASVANFWFFFAISVSQKIKLHKYYILFWLIPVTTFVLASTNEFHKLIWTYVYLSSSPYGIIAIYNHGILYFLNIAYSYILLSVGAILLIKEAIVFPKAYRTQSFVLIIAVCIPRFGDMLSFIGLGPIKGLDPGLFFFTFSAALIVFGYLKMKLLNITPIAQEIIFSNIAEGIVVTDMNNFVIEINHSATRLLNHEIKPMENFKQFVAEYYHELSLDTLDREQEIFRNIGNNNIWLEIKISPVKDISGDVLGKIYILRDITERKLSEQALKESQQHLLELNEIKNRFFSILSHDLRSPFSGLIGFVEILKDDFESLPLKEKESFITEIDVATKNIYRFLEDLLEWSRLNMGSYQVQIETLSLRREVEEVFTLLTYNAQKKCIILINELTVHDKAVGDSAMVQLLLRNLVSNAIKFSNNGDSIRVFSKKNGSDIEVYVVDTGTGIPKEALTKLFRLDVKYSTAGTANESGSGIGLVLCKEILDKLNGKIKVESILGKGSAFIFSLPHN